MLLKLVLFSFAIEFASKTFCDEDYVNECISKECFTTGFLFNQSMQPQIDPCENFYHFSCGAYKIKSEKPKHEILWNHWIEVQHVIQERLLDIVEKKLDSRLEMIQRFYQSCLENKEYVKDLILLIEIFGNWPIVESKWNDTQFNWLFLNAEFVKLLKIHPLLKIDVKIDHRNTSKYAIYLSTPHLSLPKYILTNSIEHVPEILAYKNWILSTIVYMYGNENPKWDVEVDEMIQFEIKLAKTIRTTRNKQKATSLKDLNNVTKQNWIEVLNVVFSNVNIKISEDNFVYHTDYVMSLLRLTKETSNSTVANYLIWCLVKELSRDTSSVMKRFNFEIDQAILGVQSDVPIREECIHKLTVYMGNLLMREYSREYLSSEDILKVYKIVENVRTQFVKVLKANKWLSSSTKRLIIEKIQMVKFFVGYPKLSNHLNENVTIVKNYFTNVLQLRKYAALKSLKKLNSKVRIEWPENLFDVNAYYNVLQNTILISVGLLEPPFFQYDRPAVFNYAALGTLIGHELAHALDVIGRKSDKEGNIRKWWSIKDVKMYNKKVECFEKRYQKYEGYVQENLGENLADTIGVRLGYGAYVSSRKISGVVPFLETFNDEQVFFITYAQLWCEVSHQADILQEDEHAPVEIRVLETLRSNENFEQAFRCNATLNKCNFW